MVSQSLIGVEVGWCLFRYKHWQQVTLAGDILLGNTPVTPCSRGSPPHLQVAPGLGNPSWGGARPHANASSALGVTDCPPLGLSLLPPPPQSQPAFSHTPAHLREGRLPYLPWGASQASGRLAGLEFKSPGFRAGQTWVQIPAPSFPGCGIRGRHLA